MKEGFCILDKYPKYEAVIGIEVHAQLNTKTKIFCGCKNYPSNKPNSNVCEICTGYPGSLPILNKDVVDGAIMAALGTNCKINEKSCFDRKHYVYPDCPKGYQITQNYFPYCENGFVEIKDRNNNLKKIRIHHIHMEEDAGKNTHTEGYGSLVDLNRAGSPLLEIVSEPDLRNEYEVKSYLKELHAILVSLGITTGNMEQGAFRADTNISIRLKGEKKLGTKCELKNINSFKFIFDATQHEIERQILEIEKGKKITQQTRLWNTKLKETYIMREKEDANDYRYFLEPDLNPVFINEDWLNEIKSKMPELPNDKKNRFINDYKLSEYEANVLVDDSFAADYFEEAYKKLSSKNIVNWILREVMGKAKELKLNLSEIKFRPDNLVKLVSLLENKKITQKIAVEVFEKCFENGEDTEEFIKKNNLIVEFLSEDQIRKIIEKAIAENKAKFDLYKSGKNSLRGMFIGKVMAESKGKADPKIVNKIFDSF